MVLRETPEDGGKAVRGAGCVKDVPTRGSAVIKQRSRQSLSLLGRGSHLARIAVTLETLVVARSGHRSDPIVLLMASRAGTFVNDVGLMKRVDLVTLRAVLVDDFVRELQCRAGERILLRLMALRTVRGELCMMLRNGAWVINGLGAAQEKPSHRCRTNERHDQNREEAEPPPVMRLAEIIEVALEALGDLFLRASIERHSPGASKTS